MTGKFLPGNRANPGGRPKGLSRLIDEACPGGDSAAIVRFMVGVMLGDAEIFETAASQTKGDSGTSHRVEKRNIPIAVRQRAAEWLGDHRWGKATQPVKLEDASHDLEDLSDSDFRLKFAEQLAADPELLELALAKRGEKPSEGA